VTHRQIMREKLTKLTEEEKEGEVKKEKDAEREIEMKRQKERQIYIEKG
jgi:hypothetical protein